MKILLAGNPNAGKTALFNRLTGENARVGNYPGVTVECRSGTLRRELVPAEFITEWEAASSSSTSAAGHSCSFCSACRFDRRTVDRRTVNRETGRTADRRTPVPAVVDLPGVYSLRPFSEEERVALSELRAGRADCVIHVADATCPSRSLYLTLQLAERGIPVVLALNRMDALRRGGGDVDTARLERLLGIPVVPVSAQTGEGIHALVLAVYRSAAYGRGTGTDRTPAGNRLAGDTLAKDTSVGNRFAGDNRTKDTPAGDRFAGDIPAKDIPAGNRLAGDTRAKDSPAGDRFTGDESGDRYGIHSHAAYLRAGGTDPDTALAAARYAFVDRLCREAFSPVREDAPRRRTRRLDGILTGKPVAYVVFFAILAAVFALTFPLLGRWLQAGLFTLTEGVSVFLDSRLSALDASLAGTRAGAVTTVLHSFLIGGLLRGVGSVLSFLPVVLLLFFFLAVLEDSGYLARAAYLFDRPLRRTGLSGRSAVPILLGFGCTVPALLSVRTLPSSDGRRRTAFFLPFVSCSAKLTVFVTVSAAFFPVTPALFFLYAGGIAVGIAFLLVWRAAGSRREEEPLILELPDYRMPQARQVFRLLFEKAADFLGRTFSVILFLSALTWFLSSFDGSLHLTRDVGESLLAAVCRCLLPLFRPLGFTDWRIPAALFCGLFAKEAVISTLSSLGASVPAIFQPATAAAFLTFVLFYPPCAAAEGCAARESGRGAAVASTAATTTAATTTVVGQFLLRTAIAYAAAWGIVRLF